MEYYGERVCVCVCLSVCLSLLSDAAVRAGQGSLGERTTLLGDELPVRPGAEVEYCGERVCVSVCICLSVACCPVLRFVLAKAHSVSGLTLLGDELFVVRTRSRDVEVYAATSLTPLRRLPVPQLSSLPMDLAACPTNRLYF